MPTSIRCGFIFGARFIWLRLILFEDCWWHEKNVFIWFHLWLITALVFFSLLEGINFNLCRSKWNTWTGTKVQHGGNSLKTSLIYYSFQFDGHTARSFDVGFLIITSNINFNSFFSLVFREMIVWMSISPGRLLQMFNTRVECSEESFWSASEFIVSREK